MNDSHDMCASTHTLHTLKLIYLSGCVKGRSYILPKYMNSFEIVFAEWKKRKQTMERRVQDTMIILNLKLQSPRTIKIWEGMEIGGPNARPESNYEINGVEEDEFRPLSGKPCFNVVLGKTNVKPLYTLLVL